MKLKVVTAIVERYSRGRSLARTAAAVELSPAMVRRILTAAGVPIRSRDMIGRRRRSTWPTTNSGWLRQLRKARRELDRLDAAADHALERLYIATLAARRSRRCTVPHLVRVTGLSAATIDTDIPSRFAVPDPAPECTDAHLWYLAQLAQAADKLYLLARRRRDSLIRQASAESGLRRKDVAAAAGQTRQQVRYLVVNPDYDPPVSRRGTFRTQNTAGQLPLNRLIHLYESGMTPQSIARIAGIRPESVRRRLTRAGVIR